MLVDFEKLVAAAVQDEAGRLIIDDHHRAITQAVARYSKDRPRHKVEDIAAPGGNLLPLPPAWEVDFSQLDSLEYPIGNVPPYIVEAGGWAMYTTPTGEVVQVGSAIAAGHAVRATFTVAHVLSATVDTIPFGDREPVASYAAAILADQLASLYSNDQDSTIRADSVQHTSKASEFARRAKTLRQRYFDDIGVDTKRNVAAGAVVNLNLNNSLGRDRLTHSRRYR